MSDRPRRPGSAWAARSWGPRSRALSTTRSRRGPLRFGRVGTERLLDHGFALGPGLVVVAWREVIVAWVGGHALAQFLRRCLVASRRRDLQRRAFVRAIGDAWVCPG